MSKLGIVAVVALAVLALGCSKPKDADTGKAADDQASADKADKADKAKAPEQPAAPVLVVEGAPAPDFSAEAHDGTTIQMSGLAGQPVVLYFYPKDDTPG